MNLDGKDLKPFVEWELPFPHVREIIPLLLLYVWPFNSSFVSCGIQLAHTGSQGPVTKITKVCRTSSRV